MEKLESLKRELVELDEFTPERFNDHYRNLIDIAIPSSIEYELLYTLTFISSCQIAIDSVKKVLHEFFEETPKNQPDENHCPMCEAKEKTIQTAEKLIEQAEEHLKIKNKTIDTLRKQLSEALEKLNSVNSNHLTVCEK